MKKRGVPRGFVTILPSSGASFQRRRGQRISMGVPGRARDASQVTIGAIQRGAKHLIEGIHDGAVATLCGGVSVGHGKC